MGFTLNEFVELAIKVAKDTNGVTLTREQVINDLYDYDVDMVEEYNAMKAQGY